MSAHWTDRLSEHIDGDMPAADVARLEAHLRECPACATALDELRAVVTAAADLPSTPPARDLWPGIESRLAPRTAGGIDRTVLPMPSRPRRPARRVAFTVPQLVAAGIATIILSAGGAWLTLRGPAQPAGAPATAATAPAEPAGAVAFAASYEAAVAELEAEFEARRAELDPATILVVERNLAIIDEAIGQARQALETDPASGFLNGYVADAMRRKVDLLRQATRIQRTDS